MTKTLSERLAAAQGQMENAAFDSVNPHLRNKYASLAAIRDAVIPALSKNGIALTQTIMPIDGMHYVKTILTANGETIESLCPIIQERQNAQGFGSGLTYARRYGLAAICGIASEEDDDGSEASKPVQKQAQKPAQQRHPSKQNKVAQDAQAPLERFEIIFDGGEVKTVNGCGGWLKAVQAAMGEPDWNGADFLEANGITMGMVQTKVMASKNAKAIDAFNAISEAIKSEMAA